jgi:hypothetical protein
VQLKQAHIRRITANNSLTTNEYYNHLSGDIDIKNELVSKQPLKSKNGQGQFTWSNGNYYIGEFSGGLKHGHGIWVKAKDDPNSNQYRGDFMNDKKCGYGVFKWSSGNYYKGNYHNEEKEGYGEMYWTDGSVYKGQWHNSIQHGYGTMIFPDETFIKGYFKNNAFLSGNQIPEKSRHPSIEKPRIEAKIFNLPEISKSGYKSVIGSKDGPILEDIRKHYVSSKNKSFVMSRKSTNQMTAK